MGSPRAIARSTRGARQCAARAYREDIERRVERLAAEVGFPARTREDRVRREAPARPRQLSLVW